VFAKPVASFYWNNPVYTSDPFVTFTNTSSGAVKYLWTFDNNATSSDINPKITYPEKGIYAVKLMAISEHGCLDSIIEQVQIYDDFEIYIPNAFTPNLDQLNDVFEPVFNGQIHYTLEVYNRWDVMVYRGKDKGWDGKYKSEYALPGVYIYRFNFVNAKNVSNEKIGVLLLMGK
jgi:gliding motility-associated-like protein